SRKPRPSADAAENRGRANSERAIGAARGTAREQPISFVDSPFAVDVDVNLEEVPGAAPDEAGGSEIVGSDAESGTGKGRRRSTRKGRAPSTEADAESVAARADGEDDESQRKVVTRQSKLADGASEPPGDEGTLSESDDSGSDDSESDDSESDDSESDDSDPSSERDAADDEPELSEEEEAHRYLKGLIEALLFSSDKPMNARELARA